VSPADVGLVAFAMIMVDVLGYWARIGQVETLQRQAEASDRLISTAFWMLAVAGIAVTGIIALLAEGLGDMWNEPDFGNVLLLLAPICALQALNAVPEAILKRQFRYQSIAIRGWVATIGGGLIGAFLAFKGFGVYALVVQRVSTAALQTVTAWVLFRWRPHFAFDFQDAKMLARTGFGISLAGFSATINARISDGIAGSMLGAAQLGFLRLGWRFFEFIVQFAVNPVANVALTTFSRLQHDLPASRRAYLRLTQFMALASLPMFFGIAAVADVFVPLVLGAKWMNSISVIQLFCLLILAGTVNYFFAPAMIAIGKVGIVVRQSTIQTFGTAVFVFIGAHFGIVGILAATILRAAMVAAYNVVTLKREIGLPILSLLGVLVPPTVACLVMYGTVELAKPVLQGQMNPFVYLVALCAIGAVTYGAVLLLGDFVGLWRGYMRGILGSLSGAIGRRRAASVTMTAA
jgi:O-antigen/teichoic acid export membrane protein